MTHAERMTALVEALAKVPPDERDQWGEYPAHNDAAYDLGIRTNGSAPGEICDVRLGMLGDSGPTLALALEIVRAAKVVLPLMELATTEQTAANDRLDKLLAQWEEGT